MRVASTVSGFVVLAALGVIGAFLVDDWAVVAASEMPLPVTIDQMAAAGQPYSTGGGIGFAVIGILLAGGWTVWTLHPGGGLDGLWSAVIWAALLAGSGPAYFWASFGNLNSIGDTYLEWNSGAAFALALPLYALAAAGATLALVLTAIGIVRGARRRPRAQTASAAARTAAVISSCAGSVGRSGSTGS